MNLIPCEEGFYWYHPVRHWGSFRWTVLQVIRKDNLFYVYAPGKEESLSLEECTGVWGPKIHSPKGLLPRGY